MKEPASNGYFIDASGISSSPLLIGKFTGSPAVLYASTIALSVPNLSHFSKGLYLVRLSTPGYTSVKRIVIE